MGKMNLLPRRFSIAGQPVSITTGIYIHVYETRFCQRQIIESMHSPKTKIE
jgi:hypothetical protein